jgi:hypothetical protein
MNEVPRDVALAADSESPRDVRAHAAAEIIRSARGYRWVGICDVGDDASVFIGASGAAAHDEAVTSGMTAMAATTVVPILGAESGIVIGTLDVQTAGTALADDDVAFLEECAAALRSLYD